MQELPGVHRDGHARGRRARQHEARVLGRVLAQGLGPLVVPALHGLHLREVLLLRLGAEAADARGAHIVKYLLARDRNVALALHGEAGQAVARDLRKERARNALDAEGEGGVLHDRGVAAGEHPPDIGRVVRGLGLVAQAVQVQGGIAGARGHGDDLLRLRRVGDQRHMESFLRHGLPPPAG